MLNKIIHFSLQNRILVLVASVLLLIGGTYTAMHTEVDVFPDLNAPTVVIMTEANGMAAEEVEQLVTFPVETAVNGATGVRRVRSSSTNGFSVVWVEFDWETDVYLARQIVSEKLAVVSESLPSNVGKPTLGPQSSILGEMLIVGLTADSTSMLDLRTIADWTIRPRLLSTGGVAQVAVLGGDIKEYQIQLDPERMRHYGVTLTEVMNVTREMNLNANGGVLYEYGNEYIVRGVISTDRVEQLAKAVVKLQDGSVQPATSNAPYSASPILLEDIADVRIGAKLPKLGTASERGKPAVLLTVTKQPATSTLELTDKLETSLKDLQKNLPPDVKVSTDIFRQSRFIESSIGNVQKSLFEGGIFVVIVLFLFLANVRTTVISGDTSLVADSFAAGVALYGIHHQHNEPRRYGYRHRFAGGRCHCRCGERVQTLAREPDETGSGTPADTGSRIQRFQRSAYAYPELHAHYRGKLRSSVFPERHGRPYACAFGHCLHRGIGSFYGCGTDGDTCIVLLPTRQRKDKRRKAFHRRFARSTQDERVVRCSACFCAGS